MTRPCTGDFMTCPHDADHTSHCGWHPDKVTTIQVSREMFDYLACDGKCDGPEDHLACPPPHYTSERL